MSSGIDTISNTATIGVITYHPSYSTICSVGNAPFGGHIDIIYKPDNTLLEFESVDRWLASLALSRLTIEDLCRLVFDTLREALGDIPLAVTVHAKTTVHAPASASISQGEI